MNHVRYPQVTQRLAQNAILFLLPVKFNCCRKKSATKFLCVKTFSGKVVATSFLYLMVHRWIAGNVSTLWLIDYCALEALLLTYLLT